MSTDLIKKAFDFASDTTKQLITLATALIALSVTFHGNFSNQENNGLLLWCWISYFGSVLFGIWTLMAMTGTLEKSTEKECKEPVKFSVYGANVRIPSSLQILFFLAGLFLLGFYGGKSINQSSPNQEELKVIKETTYRVVNPHVVDTLQIE
ncbi:MAG: hypothetical protein R2751_04380 [Bacteroidales bacterium]